MLSRSRTTARSVVVGAVVASPLVALATAGPASAASPTGWDDGGGMTGLDVLITFVGIPLAITIVLTLFGLVLARRTTPSYLPYVTNPGIALETSGDHTELTSGQ